MPNPVNTGYNMSADEQYTLSGSGTWKNNGMINGARQFHYTQGAVDDGTAKVESKDRATGNVVATVFQVQHIQTCTNVEIVGSRIDVMGTTD